MTRRDEVAVALQSYAPRVLEATRTPGVTVAVGERSGGVTELAFGLADLARSFPMQTDTVTQAGSLGKLHVAAMIMRLVERGMVSLSDPVTKYVPEALNPFGGRAVTVDDLLSHQGGLATDGFDATEQPQTHLCDYVAEEYRGGRTREYGRAGWRWVGGTDAVYRYSSFGIATLAVIVEKVTNRRFGDAVKEEITDPLGLSGSAFPDVTDRRSWGALMARRATGYMRFGRVAVPSPTIHSATYPATGLLSTAGDQTRLLLTLMNGGGLDGARILRDESVRAILTPQVSGQFIGESFTTGRVVEMANLGRDDFYFGNEGAYAFGYWGESRAYPHLGVAVTVLGNVWDMTRHYQPKKRTAAGLIADFVAAAFSDDARHLAVPDKSARSAGYAIGLLAGDRLFGLLSLSDIGPDGIAAMCEGARTIGAEEATAIDPGAFSAAMRAMQASGPTADGTRRFIASDASEASPEELALYALTWGASRAENPIPMGFWADQSEADHVQTAHLAAIGDEVTSNDSAG